MRQKRRNAVLRDPRHGSSKSSCSSGRTRMGRACCPLSSWSQTLPLGSEFKIRHASMQHTSGFARPHCSLAPLSKWASRKDLCVLPCGFEMDALLKFAQVRLTEGCSVCCGAQLFSWADDQMRWRPATMRLGSQSKSCHASKHSAPKGCYDSCSEGFILEAV